MAKEKVKKKRKSNAGRKPKMTKELVDKLEQAFAFGCTDEEACLYAGIHKQTLYNYQKKNPKFIDRKEQLKNKPVLLARECVVKNIKHDPDLAFKFLKAKTDEFNRDKPDQGNAPLPPITIKILERDEIPIKDDTDD